MVNFIKDNLASFTFGAQQATDYALGNKSGNKTAAQTTGALVGGAACLTSAAAFTVVTGVGVALGAAMVPTALVPIGAAGVALSPTLGLIAAKVAEVGTEVILDQIIT